MAINADALAQDFSKVLAGKKDSIYSELMAQNKIQSPLYALLQSNTIGGVQKNQYHSTSGTFLTEILQPWVDDKVAKGTLSFKAQETVQRKHIIYFTFKPEEIEGTIEGQLYNDSREPQMQDIVKYVSDQLIMAVWEDRIYKQLYNGVYATPTNNATNDASTAVNGFGKIIELGLEESDADKRINGLNIGALEDGNEYLQVQDAVMDIAEKYRYKPMVCFMSQDHAHRYSQQREEIIGTRVNTEDKSSMIIPRTNIMIMPEASMVNSDRMFVIPNWNVKRIIANRNDMSSLMAKSYDVDSVTMYGEYNEAWDFRFNKLVWANTFSNNGSGGGDEEEVLNVN